MDPTAWPRASARSSDTHDLEAVGTCREQAIETANKGFCLGVHHIPGPLDCIEDNHGVIAVEFDAHEGNKDGVELMVEGLGHRFTTRPQRRWTPPVR